MFDGANAWIWYTPAWPIMFWTVLTDQQLLEAFAGACLGGIGMLVLLLMRTFLPAKTTH